MKFFYVLSLVAFVWADVDMPSQEQQRSTMIAYPSCSSTCYGGYTQTVNLVGPCQQKTLDFLCSMSEFIAKSRAKSSCSPFLSGDVAKTYPTGSSSRRCFCDGTVTKSSCDMNGPESTANYQLSYCQYKVYKDFNGRCSRDTMTSAVLNTLCAGTYETVGRLSTPECYDGSSDVQTFCKVSADASRYKADSQCNPNSDSPQGSTSCQGDYTISRCSASTTATESGENCTVNTALQYQGYCGTSPESEAQSPISSPSVHDGLVIKKIHGHKIPVYVTRRLPKNLLIRVLRHITGSQDLVGNDWQNFYLGNFTIPYYRPDIGRKIPAYYEFEVFSDPGMRKPAGFIILTSSDPTAQHDEPVAHWNSQGPSMTKQLLSDIQQISSTSTDNTARTVFWKLDTLSYIVSKGSTLLSQIGNIPPVKRGDSGDIFNEFSSPDKGNEVIDTPYLDPLLYPAGSSSLPSDGQFKQLLWNHTESGPSQPDFVFDPTTSDKFILADYLSSYYTNFQYHIDMLRTSVKQKWLYELKSFQRCEGEYFVQNGSYECVDTVYIPVPANEETPISIPYLEAVLVMVQDPNQIFYKDAKFYKPNGQQYPILVLNTNSLPYDLTDVTKEQLSATASVSIGETIVLRYVFILVANRDSNPPPSWITYSPINPNDNTSRKLQHNVWHYYWAGTHAHQRCYNQYTYSGCAVGCGPVAWMMLFGWVDLRSSPLGGNVYGRYCAYRSGGISSGSCTANPSGIAPATTDASVRNAINNIRNRVGTFCAFGSGATFPWSMPAASGYLFEMDTGLGTSVNWNSVGYHAHGLTTLAAEEIVHRGRPAIIGTGWLSHYPLAYGYAWKSRPAGWWDRLWGTDVVYDERYVSQTDYEKEIYT